MIQMLRSFWMPATSALVAAVACAGRHQALSAEPSPVSTPDPAAATPAPRPSSLDWLAIDSANRTVTLTLEITAQANARSVLINGYRNGEARIPLEGGRPAFSNAMTRMVTEGLPPGQADQSTFVADEAGWYWLMCGVPGHALAGEWIELRVDPEATTARVDVKKG